MKRLFLILFPLAILSLFLVEPPAMQAQTATPTPWDVIIEPEPLPPVWSDGLVIDYQYVDVTIENQIATTRIEQLFVNPNDWMLEGTYFFPLPPGATVTELTMWVDGVPIESKILRKEEAREIYDAIVRQLRDPALLEYVGQDAIQASVFPIPPQSERRIEIEYQQLLPADGGLFQYIYPQSTKLYTNLPLGEQRIRVDIRSNEAIRTLYSPSHAVDDFRDGEFKAIVGYEDQNVAANTDFELYYSVSPDEIGLNLLTYKEPGQEGFFMLLAAPSVEVDPQQLVAKDIILVMDTSGSMEGEKMAQAKEAAQFVVDSLNPIDRFNIVTFSTGVRTYTPELISAEDPGNVTQYVNSLEALGGTNISQALFEALEQVDDQRPTTIIFMTDGLATEGLTDTSELLAEIDAVTPDNVRIFAFGVGDDVDTLLLDGITNAHRGTTSYVRPFERIDEELSSFATKISTPVLADISIDYGGAIVEQLYPAELPDLFAGSQLVVVGRYREGGPATITLEGDVNGETQTFVFEDGLFRSSGGEEFIPRLWATRAIGNLLTQIRLEGEQPELIESIVNLSIRYGIITPYTSYLIEEDDIFTQLGRQTIVEETMEDAEEAEFESSGEAAVDEADTASAMSEAEAPAMLATTTPAGTPEPGAAVASAPQVLSIGSKTFLLQEGVWKDTTFDGSQPLELVGFASDGYFDLLSAAPELGQYLALGEEVLVVWDNIAYQTTPGAGDPELTLPVGAEGGSPDTPENPPVVDNPDPGEEPVGSAETAETEVVDANPVIPESELLPEEVSQTDGAGQPFWLYGALGLVALLIAGLAWRVFKR